MKTYKDLITELNKYEKETAKKARAFFIKDLGHKKYKELGLNKKSSLKAFEKAAESQRSNPGNPYVSSRREAENIIGQYQDTEPGQKGRGNRVNPETGKIERYDITKKRQENLRNMSKKKSADISKIYKDMGDETGSRVYKNIGSQNRRIYQPSTVGGTELEKSQKTLDSIFPQTRKGKLTTTNIPKGKIPVPQILEPPKDSLGAMKSTVKPKIFQKALKVLGKNKKFALGAFAVGAGIGAVNAFRNRKN